MAQNFLSSINLNKNELQNGVIHVLATAPSNPAQGQIYYNSSDNKLYFYDGSNWIDASGDIKSVVTTTSNQLQVSNSTGPNPSLAIITSAVTNGGSALATGDQIYDFVISQIAAISITVQGTANEVEVTGGSDVNNGDTVTIGLPDDVTISNDLNVGNDLDVTGSVVVGGNLTVNGTTTSVNSTEVNIGDNVIVLNSGETGTPSQDAGIEVERGTSDNRSLVWDESAGDWKVQQSSGTFERISTYEDSIESAEVTAGDGIAVADNTSGRQRSYEVSLDLSSYIYKTSIGDGSTLVYAVTHNLGTEDVIVQLFDAVTKETVFADVTRTGVNVVSVGFATAPSTNAIRVLVTKI